MSAGEGVEGGEGGSERFMTQTFLHVLIGQNGSHVTNLLTGVPIFK